MLGKKIFKDLGLVQHNFINNAVGFGFLGGKVEITVSVL
jgi:two-component sensor histidine kinase